MNDTKNPQKTNLRLLAAFIIVVPTTRKSEPDQSCVVINPALFGQISTKDKDRKRTRDRMMIGTVPVNVFWMRSVVVLKYKYFFILKLYEKKR